MPWPDFETAVVDVVRLLYSRYGIKISQTPYSHDGGRDGEAQHVLAIGLGPDLAITIKVFLEIKKRSRENVGPSDIGSHMVDAFRNKVTKVIFVTNRDFTEPLSQWVDEFCRPLNIQYSLVPGTLLLEWLNKPVDDGFPACTEPTSVAETGEAGIVEGHLTYTLDTNEVIGWSAPCTVRSDRPVFAIIDLRIGEKVSPFHGVVEMVPKVPGAATVHSVGGVNTPVLFCPGDRHRLVFVIWPERSGLWDTSSFTIDLSNPKVKLILRSTNVFYVPERGLAVASSVPQTVAEASLNRSFNAWRAGESLCLRVLLSPAGLGKSFIVGRLRKEWLNQGAREVVLDGESIADDSKLVERAFSRLFPFPKGPFETDVRPALVRWLKSINLSPDACETLAADFCSPGGLRVRHYSPSLRAQILAALLAEGSGTRGLVFVLEDLHKAPPSVLNVLEEGLSLLRSWGRGKVFVLLTSRPASEATGPDATKAWLARLQEILILADDSVDIISSPSERDAREILQKTAPSLEALHVLKIIEQVGTTPFNLREAVLYLCQLGVLQILEPGGQPVLAEPARLNLLLEHDGLNRTTRRRLEVVFRDNPSWLRRLVEAGACYGRQFPFALVTRAVGIRDRQAAIDAIGDCARWSLVALSSDRRDYLEFDHDLVRAAVLALLPDLRRRQLAESLFETLKDGEESARLAALAYQAGRAEKAFELARLVAGEQRERGRPADALRANHLALLTLDPDWTRFDKRSSSWVDLAIQTAPACRREFADWRERDKSALAVLQDNLYCLGAVSAGSSELSDATLSEARILSQRLGDDASSAWLIAMEGRLLFERNDVSGALARHEEAERVFATLGKERSPERSENLVRLAICLRQTRQRDESLSMLRQALTHRVKSDWVLLNKVRSNTGAAYLLSDWNKVRYHWERQLRSARVHRLASREAHALVSLSFINLFDDRAPEGRRQAEDALEIAKAQGLDNTRVRCDLNLSVASLMNGNTDAALQYLYEAESLATQHQIGRRLWRVYANLATAHELCGEFEKARSRDLQTLISLDARTWDGESVLRRGRHLLPLINIAFRADLVPELYRSILRNNIRLETESVVKELAAKLTSEDQCPLDGILLKYLVHLNGCRRFLLTE